VPGLFAGDVLEVAAQTSANNRLGYNVQLGHYVAVTSLDNQDDDLNGDLLGDAYAHPLVAASEACNADQAWCLRELAGHYVVPEDGDYRVELVGFAFNNAERVSGDALAVARAGGVSVLAHICGAP
jgi:hypothetical protein